MTDSRTHLDAIRTQFTRQAEEYIKMRPTTDANSLVALCGTQPQHQVLDVACGPGFLTMAFAERCAVATGVDATDRFLSLARSEAASRRLPNVTFQAGDAEQLGFPDHAFDIVACRAAFHHFPHPERVLHEMKRVAKPTGCVLVADMLASEDPALAEYHNRIERLCDPTHVRALTESELNRLFLEVGLDVRFAPQREMHYDLDEWMAHGGPSPAAASAIVDMMEDSVAVDRSGLQVRREDGRLRFSHRVIAVVLHAAGASKEVS